MENNLKIVDEIKRIKSISFYDTKNTLTENFKKIILESGGGITGILSDIVLSMVKKGSQIADDVSNNILEIAGKRYQIKEVTSSLRDVNGNVIINKKLYNEAGTNEITSVTIGGKSVSASDIIKLSKNDLTNLSSTFTDDILDMAINAAKNDSSLRSQFEGIAKKTVQSILGDEMTENVIKIASDYVNAGKSVDEAIELAMKPIKNNGNYSDNEIEIIRQFFFKSKTNYPKIMAKSASKITKVLNYLDIRKWMGNLLRAVKQMKGLSAEEFTEKYTQRLYAWVQDYVNAGDDLIKQEQALVKIKQELELLLDERTFLKEYREKFLSAQKRTMDEIDNITRQTLKELNWTDNEIETFINNYKSDDINTMLQKYKDQIKNVGGTLSKDTENWWNAFVDRLGFPKDPGLIYRQILKLLGEGPMGIFKVLATLADLPVRIIRGVFKRNWKNILMEANFGTYRLPKELLRDLTRFGPGGTNIIKSIVATWIELWTIRTFITPIFSSIGFYVLQKVEDLLIYFNKKVDLVDERSPIEYFTDQYTKWINDPNTLTDIKNWLPFGVDSEFIRLEIDGVKNLVIFAYNEFTNKGKDVVEEATKLENERIQKLKRAEDEGKELLRNTANKGIKNEKWQKSYAKLNDDFETLKYGRPIRITTPNNLTKEEVIRIQNSLGSLFCPNEYIDTKTESLPNSEVRNEKICMGAWTSDLKKYYKINGDGWEYTFIDDDGKEKPIKEILSKDLADLSKKLKENYKIKMSDMKNLIRKIILEEEEEKTLKMKDWNEIFTFQKVDDKESGKFSEVKIKMDSVMDRMPHWRKKYKKQCEDIDNCDDDGEDDSFVRAVLDTHPEVVRVLFTKGMAHLTSSDDQEDLNESLHGLLAFLRESKNVEVEVWSVYRHPSSPDKIWSLVKGDYKPKELSSMDKKMQQSPGNSVEKKKDSLSELKKKESEAIRLLSTDEKKGLMELPIKVRNRVKEMIKKGWTTEKPSDNLMSYYKEDEVDSVFEDPIKVYKLRPNQTFFNFIKSQKSDDEIKRGFCRSIYYVEKEFDLPKEVSSKIDDILNKCENKLEGKYGQNYL